MNPAKLRQLRRQLEQLVHFFWYTAPSKRSDWRHLEWLLLWPCSLIFRFLSSIRTRLYRWGWYEVAVLPVPVLVVGNLTVGGTGKTPLITALAQAFRRQGQQIGIISRGYGGSHEHLFHQPIRVTPMSPVDIVGDEPILLARLGEANDFPVWIGVDRVATAKALLAAHPEVTLILSDDGLQHYALARTLELVVFDQARGAGNQRCLPAGPLREAVSRLGTVTGIIWNGGIPLHNPVNSSLAAWSGANWSMTLLVHRAYRLADPVQNRSLQSWLGHSVHAVAGIGNPDRFFQALSALGIRVTPHPFPDHHAFIEHELTFHDGLPVLITEKDAVKCQNFQQLPLWVVPAEVELEAGLIDWLTERLRNSFPNRK